MLFPERLTLLMTAFPLKKSCYEEVLGIPEAKLDRYLDGSETPSYLDMWALADYFCVSQDYLAGRISVPQFETFFPDAEKCFLKSEKTSEPLAEAYRELVQKFPNNKAVCLRYCELERDFPGARKAPK